MIPVSPRQPQFVSPHKYLDSSRQVLFSPPQVQQVQQVQTVPRQQIMQQLIPQYQGQQTIHQNMMSVPQYIPQQIQPQFIQQQIQQQPQQFPQRGSQIQIQPQLVQQQDIITTIPPVHKTETKVNMVPQKRQVTKYVEQEISEVVPREKTVIEYVPVQTVIEKVPQPVEVPYEVQIPVPVQVPYYVYPQQPVQLIQTNPTTVEYEEEEDENSSQYQNYWKEFQQYSQKSRGYVPDVAQYVAERRRRRRERRRQRESEIIYESPPRIIEQQPVYSRFVQSIPIIEEAYYHEPHYEIPYESRPVYEQVPRPLNETRPVYETRPIYEARPIQHYPIEVSHPTDSVYYDNQRVQTRPIDADYYYGNRGVEDPYARYKHY